MNKKPKMINDKSAGAPTAAPVHTGIRRFLWPLWFAAAVFASCENDAFTGTIGKEDLEPVEVTLTGENVKAAALEDAFQYIKDNIKDGQTYYIDAADFADDILYLPPAGKRYFYGVDELADTSAPNCMTYPLLKGVTINIINTGGAGKTIRLRKTSLNGKQYNTEDAGTLFYVDQKVDFIIDGNITLKGINIGGDPFDNNCPLVVVVNDGKFTLKGGAVIRDNSNLGRPQIIDGVISTNLDPMCTGGGVYMSDKAAFTMENSLITNCSATGGGGGVYMTGETTLWMRTGSVIDDNYVNRQKGNFSGGGGVMAIYGDVLAASGNTIKEQKRTIIMDGNAKITNNTVTYFGTDQKETSNQEGGGVYFMGKYDGSKIIMNDNAEISGNKIIGSTGRGGGVFLSNNFSGAGDPQKRVTLEMHGSARISNNSAGVYAQGYCEGGGLYVEYANLTMDGSSRVSGNTAQSITQAPAKGGGVFLYSAESNGIASLVMRDNSVIRDNMCIAVGESAKPGIGSGVFIDGRNDAGGSSGSINILLSGRASIPGAAETSTYYYNDTTPLDDTTNSVLVHLYARDKEADPYISISDNWQPSGIIIDAAANNSSGTTAIDITNVNKNRRRILARYQDEEWQDEVPQNIINAFKLRYFWKIVNSLTDDPNPPTSLSDNWKIDGEGCLVANE